MMRVWVVTHLYPAFGRARQGFFVERSMRLLAEDHDVLVLHFVPLHRWRPRRARSESASPHVVALPYLPGLSWVGAAAAIWSRRILLRVSQPLLRRRFGRPDIVFAQTLYPDGATAAALGRTLRAPLVTMLRGSDVHAYPLADPAIAAMCADTLRASAATLSVSRALLEEAEDRFGAIACGSVLHTCCDVDRFAVEPPHEPPRRILFVGAVERSKGISELLVAFERLLPAFPNVTLTIAGSGSLTDKIARARYAGVSLVGFVPHDAVPALLARHDVLVLPSHREGLANVVVEAVAAGRAVVATRAGGMGEIAPESPAFRLVPVGDVDALTEAVRAVLDGDAAPRRVAAEDARRFVRDRFGPAAHRAMLTRYLTNAMGEH